MFEGVGLFTILGTLSTVGIGVATPLDCYVGLATGTPSETIDIAEPVGTLGCQYDIGTTRLFGEHISSPSSATDAPGINHLGVKQLLPVIDTLTLYAGTSLAVPSQQLNGDALLGQVGTEFGLDGIKFYSEYILSIDKPSEGMLTGGIKFIF